MNPLDSLVSVLLFFSRSSQKITSIKFEMSGTVVVSFGCCIWPLCGHAPAEHYLPPSRHNFSFSELPLVNRAVSTYLRKSCCAPTKVRLQPLQTAKWCE